MGVPLVASSWWTLLLGLYGYILPFVLYASWVAIAMWDLIRREADSIPDRARWMGVVLVVPFVGPLLYFAFGRSTIPVAASADAHRGRRARLPRLPGARSCVRRLIESSSWIRIRLNALPFDSVLTTVT